MDKPTPEQREELLRWCGFEETDIRATPKSFYWKYPGKGDIYRKPRLDLNSLFEYAVPEETTIQFQQHGDKLDCVIYLKNEWYSGRASKKEYALALFWAIHSIIDKGKGGK